MKQVQRLRCSNCDITESPDITSIFGVSNSSTLRSKGESSFVNILLNSSIWYQYGHDKNVCLELSISMASNILQKHYEKKGKIHSDPVS